jgi:hypothetical protein
MSIRYIVEWYDEKIKQWRRNSSWFKDYEAQSEAQKLHEDTGFRVRVREHTSK